MYVWWPSTEIGQTRVLTSPILDMISPFTSFSTYPHFCSSCFLYSLHTPWFCRILHSPALSQSGPPQFIFLTIAEIQVDLGTAPVFYWEPSGVTGRFVSSCCLQGFILVITSGLCLDILFFFLLDFPFFFPLVSQLIRSPIR